MKLYELLFEEVVKFNNGIDQDWPFIKESKFVVVFTKDETYKKEGMTHDGVSHAIKHLIEFKPKRIKTLTDSYSRYLLANIRKLFLLDSSQTIITNQELIANELQNTFTILNTLDRINDKLKTEKPLLEFEKTGMGVANQMFSEYNQLAMNHISKATDTDRLSMHELDNLLKRNIKIMFHAMFKGNNHKYIFDIETRALVAFRDNGELNTMFKLPKKLSEYINSNGKFKNKNLEIMLKQFNI